MKKIKNNESFSKKKKIKVRRSGEYVRMRHYIDCTLSKILDEDLGGLNLHYLIEYLLKKDTKTTINYVDFSTFTLYGGMEILSDNSGYGCYWKVLKINYSRLSEKILNINSDHIIKKLQNGKCLIFIKCNIHCTKIKTSKGIYYRI